MIINYAAESEIGKGYASRTKVDGRPLGSVAMKTGLHMIPEDVFEAVMVMHGISKNVESESGDNFVSWRAEFCGDAALILSRIGGELLAAFQRKQIAEYSICEVRRIASEIREASAEQSMIGMDL